MLIQLKKNYLLLWVLRVVMVPIVLILYAAGLILQLLFGLCTAVGTLLSGLGGIAAVLALLDTAMPRLLFRRWSHCWFAPMASHSFCFGRVVFCWQPPPPCTPACIECEVSL